MADIRYSSTPVGETLDKFFGVSGLEPGRHGEEVTWGRGEKGEIPSAREGKLAVIGLAPLCPWHRFLL